MNHTRLSKECGDPGYHNLVISLFKYMHKLLLFFFLGGGTKIERKLALETKSTYRIIACFTEEA